MGTKLVGQYLADTFADTDPYGFQTITIYGDTVLTPIWDRLYTVSYLPGAHGDWTAGAIVSGGLRPGVDHLPSFTQLNGPTDPSLDLDYGDGLGMLTRTMPKSNSASYIFDGWLGNDGSFYQTVEAVLEALMVRGQPRAHGSVDLSPRYHPLRPERRRGR